MRRTKPPSLNDWLKLDKEGAGLKKRLKEAEAALDGQAYARYPKLTESEIKTLVLDDTNGSPLWMLPSMARWTG